MGFRSLAGKDFGRQFRRAGKMRFKKGGSRQGANCVNKEKEFFPGPLLRKRITIREKGLDGAFFIPLFRMLKILAQLAKQFPRSLQLCSCFVRCTEKLYGVANDPLFHILVGHSIQNNFSAGPFKCVRRGSIGGELDGDLNGKQGFVLLVVIDLRQELGFFLLLPLPEHQAVSKQLEQENGEKKYGRNVFQVTSGAYNITKSGAAMEQKTSIFEDRTWFGEAFPGLGQDEGNLYPAVKPHFTPPKLILNASSISPHAVAI